MMTEQQKREVREAIAAADHALTCLSAAEDSLSSARSWGTWDILGGGLIANIGKHRRMNEAEAHMEEAQSALAAFSKELRDVDTMIDLSFNTADFLSFADYFFDGLLADWLMQSRIKEAQAKLRETKERVMEIRADLKVKLAEGCNG